MGSRHRGQNSGGKEMKKRAFILAALFACAAFTLFADGYTKPAANQVVIVGRIVMTPEIDNEFFSNYWDIPTFMDGDNRPEQYAGTISKNTASLLIKIPAFEKPYRRYYEYLGNYSSMLLDMPKDRKVIVSSAGIYPANLNLFFIYAKINKSFLIPDGAKYLYFGTINIQWSGMYFKVDQIIVEDEYEEALKVVQNRYGKSVELVKVTLTDEPEKK